MREAMVIIASHGSHLALSLDFHSQSDLLATSAADHDMKVIFYTTFQI